MIQMIQIPLSNATFSISSDWKQSMSFVQVRSYSKSQILMVFNFLDKSIQDCQIPNPIKNTS